MDNGRALALFDFDGTLIPGDSIVAFVRFALAQGAMNKREFAKACLYGALTALRLTGTIRAKEKALAFLYRMPSWRADALCRRFAKQVLLPALYPPGLAALRRHAAKGDIVLIVTASPERYMRFAAAAMPVQGLIATTSDANGIVLQNCRGEKKVQLIREWLIKEGTSADLASSHAYGNSASDLPMLRITGHPSLINPGRALRRAAQGMAVLRWGRNRDREENAGTAL